MNIIWIGFLAGFLTSIGFIPQLVKVIQTKHTKDISLLQPVILSLGISLWLIYGIILKDWSMILANSFALICNTILIVLKLIYK